MYISSRGRKNRILRFRCLAVISKQGKDCGSKSRHKTRRGAVNTDYLPASPEAKPAPNVTASFPLVWPGEEPLPWPASWGDLYSLTTKGLNFNQKGNYLLSPEIIRCLPTSN